VTAKIIDVETGAILWTGVGSGDTGKALSTFVGAAVGVAAGAAIGNVAVGGSDRAAGTVLGGIGGGILGGVAGNALAPKEEEVLNRVIVKMTEKLPARVVQLK
jgi:hypothetical protein